MRDRTKLIATCALLTGMSLVIMFLTSLIPVMQYALVAIAGLLPTVIVIQYRLKDGFFVYAATAILGAILLPDKEAALLYLLLFGHYPMVKSLIERLKPYWLQWVVKLALFNGLTFSALFLAEKLFTQGLELPDAPIYVFYLVANAAFVVYDLGFTKLITYFYPRLRKGFK